ncbi:unannotated protein [freshwater metagenome]|uniref:Unannotated protein n=1 Tax=freshwater metagenome TaxID=449393 RepID=A0A6J6H9W8_9ZZZZ
MAVGADHHAARERVLLEHDLVDDAGAGLPEADAVLGRNRFEEVVDLGVDVVGDSEVDATFTLGLDEMVAVDCRRHGDLGQAGGHELEQRHLGGGVLHGDAIGIEIRVAATALELLILRIAEMVHENLLGERERATQTGAAQLDTLGEAAVDGVDQFDRGGGGNGHGGTSRKSADTNRCPNGVGVRVYGNRNGPEM